MASERLGTSIASLDDPTREGTKGLYLRHKDTGAILVLTCRHEIFQGSELSNDLYQHKILDFGGPSLVPIGGIMPEAEIKMPTTMDSHNKEPRLVVAMYGNISKVKTGFSNCITSILRGVINGEVEYSEEWGIIERKAGSSTGSKPFAVPGDSGSCIWDMDGRVAGIVVWGLDVTYAHPIEWLLEDIRTQSGIYVELI
ncbi:unnamed protein product [Clonostachys solani]|uniref:Uncharacterized protein n=1 Tax=Clonostachys solani TaxID=160281 RepID=A0A9N9Z1W7_9HYPO|nr:unnamed protein product [Clonostachys solani]